MNVQERFFRVLVKTAHKQLKTVYPFIGATHGERDTYAAVDFDPSDIPTANDAAVTE